MLRSIPLFLLLALQPMTAYEQKTWFQQLRVDIQDVMEGVASSEQKERLAKQAGITILALSITLYSITALSAMWHGHGDEIFPLELGSFPRPPGPRGRRLPSHRKRRPSDSSLQRHSSLKVPGDMEDLFGNNSMPNPRKVLRREDDPDFKQVAHQGVPDTDGIKNKERLSMEMPEPPIFNGVFGSPFS